jgi:hypothetical protein
MTSVRSARTAPVGPRRTGLKDSIAQPGSSGRGGPLWAARSPLWQGWGTFVAPSTSCRLDNAQICAYLAGQQVGASGLAGLAAAMTGKGRRGTSRASRPFASESKKTLKLPTPTLSDFEILLYGQYRAAMSLTDFAELMADSGDAQIQDDQVLVTTLAQDHAKLRRIVSGLRDKIPPALINELTKPIRKKRDHQRRLLDKAYAIVYRELRLNGVDHYYVDHLEPDAPQTRVLARQLSVALERVLHFLAELGYLETPDRLRALIKLVRLLAPTLLAHYPRGGHEFRLRRYNNLAVATFAQYRRILARQGITSPYHYTAVLD